MGHCVMYILRGSRPQQLEESVVMHITGRPKYSGEANVETISLPTNRSMLRMEEEREGEGWKAVVRAMEVRRVRELILRLPQTPVKVLNYSITFGQAGQSTMAYLSTSQTQFYGETNNQQRQGFGIQYWPALKSLYTGQFEYDRINGLGILTHQSGDKYEGYWRDDQAHGRGIYTHADGSQYEGDWVCDKKHGLGRHEWADGQVYEGQYVNGLKEGKGKLTFPPQAGQEGQAVYEGDFKADMMEGTGEYKWPDGRMYKGTWQRGKMHGRGKYTWVDPSGTGSRSYEGEYREGKKHGIGVFTWPNGSSYEGQWANGQQHGRGKFTNTTSIQHQGIWHNGTLVRFVTSAEDLAP